ASTDTRSIPADIAAQIKKVAPEQYAVDRRVVDKVLENPIDLVRSVRVVPEQENGRFVGLRLLGFGADSLLGLLGLQTGDRLQGINGRELSDPQKALEAYAAARTADHLTLQLNRRGRLVQIDYSIQ